MATQFKVADVETSLISALQADTGLTALKVQVSALSSKQWDEQGNLLVIPPAVLVLFESAQDTLRGDITRKTYQSAYDFAVFCGAQDMTSPDKERTGCYAIISAVRFALAGIRLPLDAGADKTVPVQLLGVTPEQFGNDGVWYAVRARIEKTAQFG